LTANPLLQKIPKGMLQTEDEYKQTMKEWEMLTLKRRTDSNQRVA
jgi:hypothetical protein